jgi:hypothetical protein
MSLSFSQLVNPVCRHSVHTPCVSTAQGVCVCCDTGRLPLFQHKHFQLEFHHIRENKFQYSYSECGKFNHTVSGKHVTTAADKCRSFEEVKDCSTYAYHTFL